MHTGDSQTHHHRACDCHSCIPASLQGLQSKFDPQSKRGQNNRNQDRQNEQLDIVTDHAIKTHSRHSGVVHGTDTGTKQHSACGKPGVGEFRTADDFYCKGTGKNAGNHRQEGNSGIIVAGTGQAESEHADEMHCPYTDAQA